jgi:integrase/recombinase XerC
MSIQSFENYLALERNYSPHTVKAYISDLEAFALFCSEKYQTESLEEIDYSLMRSWLISLVEAGLSGRSLNRKTASLKAYYNYLLRTGQINANPLKGHKPVKSSKKLEVPFSEQEMDRLFQLFPEAHTFEDMRNQLIFEILYTTGIRRSELTGLKLSDLDLSSATLKVLGKRNKERLMPLLKGVVERFEAYLDCRKNTFTQVQCDALFLTSKGNKINDSLVYRIINRYLEEVSDKSKRSPHVLRHTFATHLLNNGADINAVKELLGHSSLASTQVYTHNSIAELRRIHEGAHPRNLDETQ